MAFTLIDEVFLSVLHYDNTLEMFTKRALVLGDPKCNFQRYMYMNKILAGRQCHHLHIFKRDIQTNWHLSQCYLYSYRCDGSSLAFAPAHTQTHVHYNYKVSDAIANCKNAHINTSIDILYIPI